MHLSQIYSVSKANKKTSKEDVFIFEYMHKKTALDFERTKVKHSFEKNFPILFAKTVEAIETFLQIPKALTLEFVFANLSCPPYVKQEPITNTPSETVKGLKKISGLFSHCPFYQDKERFQNALLSILQQLEPRKLSSKLRAIFPYYFLHLVVFPLKAEIKEESFDKLKELVPITSFIFSTCLEHDFLYMEEKSSTYYVNFKKALRKGFDLFSSELNLLAFQRIFPHTSLDYSNYTFFKKLDITSLKLSQFTSKKTFFKHLSRSSQCLQIKPLLDIYSQLNFVFFHKDAVDIFKGNRKNAFELDIHYPNNVFKKTLLYSSDSKKHPVLLTTNNFLLFLSSNYFIEKDKQKSIVFQLKQYPLLSHLLTKLLLCSDINSYLEKLSEVTNKEAVLEELKRCLSHKDSSRALLVIFENIFQLQITQKMQLNLKSQTLDNFNYSLQAIFLLVGVFCYLSYTVNNEQDSIKKAVVEYIFEFVADSTSINFLPYDLQTIKPEIDAFFNLSKFKDILGFDFQSFFELRTNMAVTFRGKNIFAEFLKSCYYLGEKDRQMLLKEGCVEENILDHPTEPVYFFDLNFDRERALLRFFYQNQNAFNQEQLNELLVIVLSPDGRQKRKEHLPYYFLSFFTSEETEVLFSYKEKYKDSLYSQVFFNSPDSHSIIYDQGLRFIKDRKLSLFDSSELNLLRHLHGQAEQPAERVADFIRLLKGVKK